MGGGMFDGLGTIILGFFVFLGTTILLTGYCFYFTFIKDNSTIKTKEKPVISWELKAKGQTVDTVWVYKFK